MKADAKTTSEDRTAISSMLDHHEKGNGTGLRACLALDDDLTLIGTGEDEFRRGPAEAEAKWMRDWAQTDAISMRLGDVSVSASGDVVWASTRGSFEISASGQTMSLPGRATFVLVHGDGAWRIVQAHYSTPAADQEAGSSIPG